MQEYLIETAAHTTAIVFGFGILIVFAKGVEAFEKRQNRRKAEAQQKQWQSNQTKRRY